LVPTQRSCCNLAAHLPVRNFSKSLTPRRMRRRPSKVALGFCIQSGQRLGHHCDEVFLRQYSSGSHSRTGAGSSLTILRMAPALPRSRRRRCAGTTTIRFRRRSAGSSGDATARPGILRIFRFSSRRRRHPATQSPHTGKPGDGFFEIPNCVERAAKLLRWVFHNYLKPRPNYGTSCPASRCWVPCSSCAASMISYTHDIITQKRPFVLRRFQKDKKSISCVNHPQRSEIIAHDRNVQKLPLFHN
jgi:hypothetical protein